MFNVIVFALLVSGITVVSFVLFLITKNRFLAKLSKLGIVICMLAYGAGLLFYAYTLFSCSKSLSSTTETTKNEKSYTIVNLDPEDKAIADKHFSEIVQKTIPNAIVYIDKITKEEGMVLNVNLNAEEGYQKSEDCVSAIKSILSDLKSDKLYFAIGKICFNFLNKEFNQSIHWYNVNVPKENEWDDYMNNPDKYIIGE